MSARPVSVLSKYNPLTDPHLAAHYSNKRRRKQLKSAGLIKKNGELISEREWIWSNQNKETRAHMKDLLAQAVVQKALEIERGRQVDIRNQLEMMAKKERVRRIRAERSRTEIVIKTIKVTSGAPRNRSAQFSRRKGSPEDLQKTRKVQKIHELDYDTLKMIKKEVDRNRAFHPAQSPFDKLKDINPKKISNLPNLPDAQARKSHILANTGKRSSGVRLHRPEPGMIVKVRQQTLCEMKYKYIGRPGIGETAYLEPEDIVIEQQHCGGETIKVYHGLNNPGEIIQFTSRRHRGYPYSIVMYVNNIRVERISSCCEYKYKKGAKLGTGSIQFLSVEGAAPCFKCNVRKGLIKDKPDAAPRPLSRHDSKEKNETVLSSRSEPSPTNDATNEEVKTEGPVGEKLDKETENNDNAEKEPIYEVREHDHDERSLTPTSTVESDNEVSNEDVSSDTETKTDKSLKSSKLDDPEAQYVSTNTVFHNVMDDNEDQDITQVTSSASSDEDSDDSESETDDSEDEVDTAQSLATPTANILVEKVLDNITGTLSPKSEASVVERLDIEQRPVSARGPSRSQHSRVSDGRESKSTKSLTTPTANLLVDEVLDQLTGGISPDSLTSPTAQNLVSETLDKITLSDPIITPRSDESAYTNVTEDTKTGIDSDSN